MIYDKLLNIKKYGNLPDSVINFISKISSNMKLGRYEIEDGIYANVELYSTKTLHEACYEAHENYVDIQILLKGVEHIYYCQKDGLKIKIPYNKDKDISFYSNNVEGAKYVLLNGTNFVILFPWEAHAPQVCVDNTPEEVLKLVVKIRKDLFF